MSPSAISEDMFAPTDFFDLSETDHGELFSGEEEVWAAIGRIAEYLDSILAGASGEKIHGTVHPSAQIGEAVVVREGAVIEANAVIKGPAWIGSGTTVRSGAYVRENVIVGNDCMLGNSSEFKNCLLFNKVETPHFNYVGDSILGFKAHLGAGVICSNVRLDRRNVTIRTDSALIDTGLRKFGAVVGDRSEVGCNSVLSPGTILGKDAILYPCTHWQGVLPDSSIVKNKQQLEVVKRHLN